MYPTKIKLIVSCLLVTILSYALVSCKKDQAAQQQTDQSKSSQKDIISFEFFKADNSNLNTDYNTAFTGTTITGTLPSGTNLTALKAGFTTSEKATVSVNNKLQTSQVTPNDFSQPVTYTVKAENGSTKNYTVIITAK